MTARSQDIRELRDSCARALLQTLAYDVIIALTCGGKVCELSARRVFHFHMFPDGVMIVSICPMVLATGDSFVGLGELVSFELLRLEQCKTRWWGYWR